MNSILTLGVLLYFLVQHKFSILFQASGIRHERRHHVARKIYIDFGLNDGQSLKTFLGDSIQNEDVGSKITRANDGSETNGGLFSVNMWTPIDLSIPWDLFAFEANANYTNQLNEQRENIIKNPRIKSYTLYSKTAITTYDGNITFINDCAQEGCSGDAGSTTMKDSRSAVGSRVIVNAMDISTLFKIHSFTKNDYIVIKCDIEGGEYDLVRKIFVDGIIDFIDQLAVEW